MQSGHTNSVGKVASWHLHRRTLHRAALPVIFFASFFCAASLSPARAYTFSANPPHVWPNGNVTMVLKLGSAGRTLIDGATSWDSVARQALTIWNGYLGTIQFAPTIQGPGVGSDGDYVNQAFFNSTLYGQAFGSGVVAVTTGWYSGTTRTEADVTFNNAISWDSYRGPLRFSSGQSLPDLRRVALHEFGHVLGLGHPNQAGQTVNAIMNSVISDLDNLTSDDISGARVLYPAQTATFTTQPQSKTVVVGSTVTFSVAASGSLPIDYQWRLNGVNIPGAINTDYTISNVQSSHAGNYTVVVNNAGGTVTSTTAVLTVNVPPSITAQPQSRTVTAGNSVTFSVTASGTAPLAYQWRRNDLNIPGATSASFTISSVQTSQAGDYTVVVNNAGGTATSATALLAVNVPPSITAQPQSEVVAAGSSAMFSVTASGTAPLSYQWYFSGSAISGATTATYSFASAQPNNAGNYQVRVSNSAGFVDSGVPTLTVNVPPSITAQPASKVVSAGNSVTFTVAATGTSPLSYQWYFIGSPISGATASSYSLANAQPNNAGDYKVRVSNSGGNVDSAAATLTVQYAPVITSQPQNQTVIAGGAATFNVAANGVPTPAYQWSFNASAILGANTSSYTVANAQSANVGSYTVAVSNARGSVTSDAATLIIPAPAFITIARQGGNSITLTITGTVGAVYSVEYVTDLAQTNAWRGLALLQLAATNQSWIDTTAPITGRRFYRAVATVLTNTGLDNFPVSHFASSAIFSACRRSLKDSKVCPP